MTQQFLTIATRESPLALWQANWVKSRLEKTYPNMLVELLGITTRADKLLDIPLTEVGGKGLFVKELEEALLDGRADIAVHSMKDVPMELPPGLTLSVMCEREEPRDVFVSNEFNSLFELPVGALVGTSSLRRRSQIAAMRKDLNLTNLRGNVNTRLDKLDRGDYSGLILAAAGLKRLDLKERIRSFLSLDESLPAAGQGVLGIECRENDLQTQKLIAFLNHSESAACVIAERMVCKVLNGGCQSPVAAFAEMVQGQIVLRGLVAKVDGTLVLRSQHSDKISHSEQLGKRVAMDLLGQGAEEILTCL